MPLRNGRIGLKSENCLGEFAPIVGRLQIDNNDLFEKNWL